MDFTWPNILTGLVRGEDLDSSTTEWAMGEILAGNASPVQMAGFMGLSVPGGCRQRRAAALGPPQQNRKVEAS